MLRGLVGQGLLASLALCGISGVSRGEDAAAPTAIEFNRDVRPILAENCFRCHGPDSASRKADLRLDRREAAIESGAIVPGKPDESELVERIFSTDAEKVMPPPAIHKDLKPAEKELLKQWVAAGAQYQPHWSLIAPVRPAPPTVKNEAWVRTPIDRFVLARLEQHGLAPAPPADRYTMARRLSLDLVGLPPEPAEVERFVNDSSPDAYEQYVERLLAMPEWGEHRGRYWLDAARYGDTHGIHIDNYREIWSYRNWVIQALNDNMPFDRFTIEQLAGDLLPNRTLEQQIASGFNRCNITTSEGGAIDEEYRVLYDRDRTETTSQVWLGLTTGCAVCHDHKFDPISQREFYELAAFFNNTTQAAMDGNIKDTPPVQFVPKPEDRARHDKLVAELPAVRGQIEARKQSARPDFDAWLPAGAANEIAKMIPSEGLRLQLALSEGSGETVNMTLDGQSRTVTAAGGVAWEAGHVAAQSFKSQPGAALEVAEAGDFEKDQPFTTAVWIKLSQEGMSGAIVARMNDQVDHRGWDLGVENGRVNAHIINNWDQDAMKIVTNTAVKVGEWNHVLVTYNGSGKAAGLKIYFNGVPQPSTVVVDKLQNTIRTEVPLKIAQRQNASRINGAAIQDLRIYGRILGDAEVSQLAKATRVAYLVAKPAAERTEPETAEVYAWWLVTLDKPTQELTGQLAGLEGEEKGIKSRGTVAHVMQERTEPAMAFVLFRGEYDKRRDQVAPGTPAALPPMPADLPRNRLGLAQWLLRPEHPLTTRVTVNRFWQELFGTGLVRTTGDLGISGEMPSHPELLDWMAVEFRESGWDMKKFYRLLVTSAVYRQSATVTPEKLENDGHNRLFSRGPRFRMDAEVVRDYALASSGLLVHKLGGPSVRPYQPPGVWEAVSMGGDTHDYVQDHGENLYRRSMYTFWKRSAPPASMEILNAPSREVCTVRRERTNTPMQALVVLNDPQFIEASRHLAERALTVAGDAVENRLDFLGRRLLARPWRMEELAVLQTSITNLVAYYQGHLDEAKQVIAVGETPADASLDVATLAGWTMLANEVMNLDEVVCK